MGYSRTTWTTPYGLQVEEVVQAHGKAGIVAGGDFTDGKQYARHEGDAIEAVCTDGQLLTGIAEKHLLMGVEAAQPHGMHVNAVDDLTARTTIGFGIVRNLAKTGRITGIGDGMSRCLLYTSDAADELTDV